jgi:hypothetical protein
MISEVEERRIAKTSKAISVQRACGEAEGSLILSPLEAREHQASRGQSTDAPSAAQTLSWDRQDWGG